jgi:hypothetical protein
VSLRYPLSIRRSASAHWRRSSLPSGRMRCASLAVAHIITPATTRHTCFQRICSSSFVRGLIDILSWTSCSTALVGRWAKTPSMTRGICALAEAPIDAIEGGATRAA